MAISTIQTTPFANKDESNLTYMIFAVVMFEHYWSINVMENYERLWETGKFIHEHPESADLQGNTQCNNVFWILVFRRLIVLRLIYCKVSKSVFWINSEIKFKQIEVILFFYSI